MTPHTQFNNSYPNPITAHFISKCLLEYSHCLRTSSIFKGGNYNDYLQDRGMSNRIAPPPSFPSPSCPVLSHGKPPAAAWYSQFYAVPSIPWYKVFPGSSSKCIHPGSLGNLSVRHCSVSSLLVLSNLLYAEVEGVWGPEEQQVDRRKDPWVSVTFLSLWTLTTKQRELGQTGYSLPCST